MQVVSNTPACDPTITADLLENLGGQQGQAK